MLFAVFIVLFGVSSTALTTFGKSPPNPPPPPTPPPGKSTKEIQLELNSIRSISFSINFRSINFKYSFIRIKKKSCFVLLLSVKARECTSHFDCSSIQHTSCVRDGTDNRIMRCLCGNNKAPINGYCTDTVKREYLLFIIRVIS